mgnify:CR=1 FL=1
MSHASHFASTCFSSPKVTGTLNVPANSGSGDAPDLSEAQPDKQCDPVITTPTEGAPAASETAHPAAPTAVGDTGDDPTPIPTEAVTDAHPSEPVSEPAAEPDATAENTDKSQAPNTFGPATECAGFSGTGATGGTGGVGFGVENPSSEPATEYSGFSGTGETGAAGFNAADQIKKAEAAFAELFNTSSKMESEAMARYMSATGAAGMPGSLEEAAKMGMDFGKARSHFKQQVRGKQPEEQAVIVKKTWADVAQKMSKLRSDEAGFAVILGDMANVMKECVPHGKWTSFVREHFKGLELRTLQDYQKIATVQRVERHLDLGVTKLVKLASLVAKGNLASEEDPIQVILDAASAKFNYQSDNYELLANVAIANHRIVQAGLRVDPAALFTFVESGYALAGKDITEMAKMQEVGLDPTEFLREVVKYAGARVFRLTGAIKGKAAPDETPPAIPDINTTLQRTSDAIMLALGRGELNPSNFDRSLFKKCKSLLNDLEKKVFAD